MCAVLHLYCFLLFLSLSLVCARMIDLSRQLHSCEAVSQFGLTCISATRSIFVQLLTNEREGERTRDRIFIGTWARDYVST